MNSIIFDTKGQESWRLVVTLMLMVCVSFGNAVNTLQNLNQLMIIGETYEEYKLRFEKGCEVNGTLYKYEKYLNEEDFHSCLYNLEARRIPNYENGYSYNKYVSQFQSYCQNEHTTYDIYRFHKQMAKFVENVNELSLCIDYDNVKNTKEATAKSDESETTNTETETSTSNVSETQSTTTGTSTSNVSETQSTTPENPLKSIIAHCLGQLEAAKSMTRRKSFVQRTLSANIFTRLVPSNTKITCFLEKLTYEQTKKVHGCMTSFVTKLDTEIKKEVKCFGALTNTKKPSPFLDDSDSTSKQTLAKDTMIKHFSSREWNFLRTIILNEIDNKVNSMVVIQMFKEFNELKELPDRQTEVGKCQNMVARMDEFIALQLMDTMIPNDDLSLTAHSDKKKYLISELKRTHGGKKNNKKLFDPLEKYVGSLNDIQFASLKTIRASSGEDSYSLYALRLLRKGIIPLTTKLWKNEKSSIDKSQADVTLEKTHKLYERKQKCPTTTSNTE